MQMIKPLTFLGRESDGMAGPKTPETGRDGVSHDFSHQLTLSSRFYTLFSQLTQLFSVKLTLFSQLTQLFCFSSVKSVFSSVFPQLTQFLLS